MKIKPMLARLESAMGRHDLSEQMVLLPEPANPGNDKEKSAKSINLVVGYSSSPGSQTALDLTLWIAHQTRLATQKQVTVQVVYVIDENQPINYAEAFNLETDNPLTAENDFDFSTPLSSVLGTSVLSQPKPKSLKTSLRGQVAVDRRNYKTMFSNTSSFEKADRILWQARCLAEEWRGSFKAHLRFGNTAEELKKVVQEEQAVLLFLGCNGIHHPIVRQLGKNFPCAVLGIPKMVGAENRSHCYSDSTSS